LSAPPTQDEKSMAARSNRRNVRRVDYKEGKLPVNSSAPNNFDMSAPNEFAVPQNPLLEKATDMRSSELVMDDSIYQMESKRQKIVDPYEQMSASIANSIAVFNEPASASLKEKSMSGTTSVFNPNNLKDKSMKKMMEHYQREDDEGCYYSNAIKCSFDDPRLCFEEMCYLCGSFGNQTDFVTCTLCAESFHTFCL